MLYNILFWITLCILVIVLLTGLIMAILRSRRNNQNDNAEASTIYTSGVFSLIRKSPRNEILQKEPSMEEIVQALGSLAAQKIANGTPQQYMDGWRRVTGMAINNIEKGDRDGVMTYRYRVPEKCKECCAQFGGDAYVTREQLHNHIQLIPPFHLGCGVELLTKDAWNPGSENAGWTPILPVNGKYQVPDWKIVVPL